MISYTNIQLILLYTKKFCYICADNIPLANPWEFPWRTPYPSFWASWDCYLHGIVRIIMWDGPTGDQDQA
jgi:hypothetical protein